MRDGFEVVIPGRPPSLNQTYRVVTIKGHGRLAKTSVAATWQDEVAWRVRQARPSNWMPGRRIRIAIRWWMNRPGRDADNPQKLLLDGIAHGLGIDDQGFLPCVRSNEVDRANPRTIVLIENEDDE